MIPPKFLQVQIDEIFEELSLSINATNNKHILPKQSHSMIPSSFNRLLIAHFQRTWSPSLKIDQIDSIVAHSTLPADIVYAHSSKYNDESVFVENWWVVASGSADFELLHPCFFLKWVDLCLTKGIAAVSSYNHCHILVDRRRMALPGFRLPALEIVGSADHGVFDILMDTLGGWFLNDLSYLGIQSRQSLFLIVVDVQYLLVFQWLLHIVI